MSGHGHSTEPGDTADALYEVTVGRSLCHELLFQTRRPMFDRVRLYERMVIAHPRPNVKNQEPAAFDLDTGQHVDPERFDELRRRTTRTLNDLQSHRLRVASWAAVGKGASRLEFYVFDESEPVEVAEVPDAISGIERTTFGWYVGCRDGYLYAFNRVGRLLWRWQTPGSGGYQPDESAARYFRPCPYRMATDGERALVASWSKVWSISSAGATTWTADLRELIKPREVRVGRRELRDVTSSRVSIAREGITLRIGQPFMSVSVLAAYVDSWFVGGAGEVFRFDRGGRLELRQRVSQGGHVASVFDREGRIVAFASQPNIWYIGGNGPLRLPDEYQWPYWLSSIGGNHLIAHRPGDRHLGLIDDQGRLIVQVRARRSITDFDFGNDVLAFVAGGCLVALQISGQLRS